MRYSLEGGGVLSPPDSSGAVDGAYGAASIAVPATVGHAGGASVWVEAAVGNRRRGHADDGGCRIHRGAGGGIRHTVGGTRDDGKRIGTSLFATET